MVRRVCRELGTKKNIIVINDEAHHCYRRKPDGEEVKLTGDDRKEAEERDKAARVWISGVEAVKAKIGVKAIYDLSATPFFLRGSGWPEATLFPWVVSDFSLIDAIEAGIVKVPRVPVSDDSMMGEQPTYRDLWLRIREHLPKQGRKTEAVGGEPSLVAPAFRGPVTTSRRVLERFRYRLIQRSVFALPLQVVSPNIPFASCQTRVVQRIAKHRQAKGMRKPGIVVTGEPSAGPQHFLDHFRVIGMGRGGQGEKRTIALRGLGVNEGSDHAG